jgi:hypothetical protein
VTYPFVQARNYTRVGGRDINLIVVHDMEAPERLNTAENVAAWFAGSTAPRASAHYNIDADSIVQSVRDMDVAWHAPGANHNGIGLEHAGYARQSRAEWLDDYGLRMLRLSARLTAELCAKYEIPVRRVTYDGLRAGVRGITGHHDVSLAFVRSSHWDPGPDFPWDFYLEMVKAELSKIKSPPKPVVHWRWQWARWWLGEGEYRSVGQRHPASRPETAPKRIPPWAWVWLAAFIAKRKK